MKKQWGNHFNIDEGRVGTLFRLMKAIGWEAGEAGICSVEEAGKGIQATAQPAGGDECRNWEAHRMVCLAARDYLESWKSWQTVE